MSLLVPFPQTKIISIPIPEIVKLSWFEYITFKLRFPFVNATKLVKVGCIKMPTHLQLTHIDKYYLYKRKCYGEFPIYCSMYGIGDWGLY